MIFRYEPPPRSKVPFAAQLEYASPSWPCCRARGPAIAPRDQGRQGPAREEGRGGDEVNLPTRDRSRARPSRIRGVDRRPEIQLGEPVIQDHDKLKKRILDDFEGMLSLRRTPPPRSDFKNRTPTREGLVWPRAEQRWALRDRFPDVRGVEAPTARETRVGLKPDANKTLFFLRPPILFSPSII